MFPHFLTRNLPSFQKGLCGDPYAVRGPPANFLYHEYYGEHTVIRGNKGDSFVMGTILLGGGKGELINGTESFPLYC